MENEEQNPVRGGILGLVVGDALGVPVESVSREALRREPVTGMRGYGTYHQPPGTWSDDSSLTLCTADALCEGYDPERIARRFVDWLYGNAWTAHGDVFDVGITSAEAIGRLQHGVPHHRAGASGEFSNGNGSLMRILPLAFYLRHSDRAGWFEPVREVSAITHAHLRSGLACLYYVHFAVHLCAGAAPEAAYRRSNEDFQAALRRHDIPGDEAAHLSRILDGGIDRLAEHDISSTGYVIHTLEASLWCLLHATSYRETVLRAVNLGHDADSTAAVAGGLAGIAFGHRDIPEEWLAQIAGLDRIEALIARFGEKYGG
ncbi:MAG: ADP-ribosylglycohydrolase family protein [Lewinellaceae bacterium]|nr:ADP-ribosylglycohydrolase family protein [Lewinellaceae bacterium]